MNDDTDDRERRDAGEHCNARKTGGDGYCKQPAGWGTDHNGTGRCKFHGGNTRTQEKGIVDDLEDAAEDGALALSLRLKQIRRELEDDPNADIDWSELDRLARTVFDRSGHGPSEKHEHENAGDDPLAEIVVDFTDADT